MPDKQSGNDPGGRSMRFCMVTTFYPPYSFGGDGFFVHRLSNALARRGHQVDVIHCVDSYRLLGGGEPTQAPDDHPNVRVHSLRSPWGMLSPLATHQTGRAWLKSPELKRILESGFDVIHYHNVSLVGGAEVLHFGEGIKLYTTHEYWLICPTHTLFKRNREICRQPQCFRCSMSYKRPPQLWRQSGSIDAAIQKVDAFLSPSRSCIDLHQRAGFRSRMIHLPGFARSGNPPASDEAATIANPYFLFVGRLEKLKGLHTVIPVFRRRPEMRLRIAGSGVEESRLRRMSEGAGNIEFLGDMSGEQLSKLYREAVAVIVPSLCYETFSLVTVEAFQNRTPVIGRNLGGVAELIDESGGGIKYETDAELAAAMDLLQNHLFRRELAERGHEAYRLKWSEEAHIEKYFAILHEISQSHRGLSGLLV